MKLNFLESFNINSFITSFILLIILYIVFNYNDLDLLKIFDDKEDYLNNNPTMFYIAIGTFVYIYFLLISCNEENETFTNQSSDMETLSTLITSNPNKLFRFKTSITMTDAMGEDITNEYYLSFIDKSLCIEPTDISDQFSFNDSCTEKLLILKDKDDMISEYNNYLTNLDLQKGSCTYTHNHENNVNCPADPCTCLENVELCNYVPQYTHDFKLENDDTSSDNKILMYGFNLDINNSQIVTSSVININSFNPNPTVGTNTNETNIHNQVCGTSEHATDNIFNNSIFFEIVPTTTTTDDDLIVSSTDIDINTELKSYLYVKKLNNDVITDYYFCTCTYVMCLTGDINNANDRKTYYTICLKPKENGNYPQGILTFDILLDNKNNYIYTV